LACIADRPAGVATVGYEFEMSHHMASSQQGAVEARKMSCLVAKVGLTLHLNSKLCAGVWYTASHKKKIGSNGVSIPMTDNF
jgi:hypothetical protein